MSESCEEVKILMRVLRQKLGNKVYLRDLEPLLAQINLESGHDRQTIQLLASDLRNLKD